MKEFKGIFQKSINSIILVAPIKLEIVNEKSWALEIVVLAFHGNTARRLAGHVSVLVPLILQGQVNTHRAKQTSSVLQYPVRLIKLFGKDLLLFD